MWVNFTLTRLSWHLQPYWNPIHFQHIQIWWWARRSYLRWENLHYFTNLTSSESNTNISPYIWVWNHPGGKHWCVSALSLTDENRLHTGSISIIHQRYRLWNCISTQQTIRHDRATDCGLLDEDLESPCCLVDDRLGIYFGRIVDL
jgi:hypothetical protein